MAETDLLVSIRSDSSKSSDEDTRQRAYPQYDRSIVEQYENIALKGMATVNELGHGLYGHILRVILPNGELHAAKEIDVTEDAFFNECSVHSRLDHQYIVRFLGVSQLYCRSRLVDVLVTELLSMNLYHCKEHFPEMPLVLSVTVSILCDIAEGMAYLHSLKPPIVHGDLAPRHILLTDYMRAKISGFAMAQVLDGTPLKTCPCRGLDIPFMPPELFCANPVYDGKLDVYSFGVLVVYVVATYSTITNSVDGENNFDTLEREILRHSIRDHCLYSLTEQCLQENSLKRIDSDTVVQILKQLSRKHPRCLRDILELRCIEDVDLVSCTLLCIFVL